MGEGKIVIHINGQVIETEKILGVIERDDETYTTMAVKLNYADMVNMLGSLLESLLEKIPQFKKHLPQIAAMAIENVLKQKE